MSGNRSHGRGGERPPLLLNCLWNGIAGLPTRRPCGILMAPSIYSEGTCLWPPFWNIPSEVSSTREEPTLVVYLCHYSCSTQDPPQGPNNSTIHLTRWCAHPSQEMKLQGLSEELPHLRHGKMRHALYKIPDRKSGEKPLPRIQNWCATSQGRLL